LTRAGAPLRIEATERRPPDMSDRTWERIGALSGLVSAVLFGVALIIFLATDPTGTPRIPDLANAADASVYIRDHEDASSRSSSTRGYSTPPPGRSASGCASGPSSSGSWSLARR
jgi:hypothetical protein